VSRNCFKNRLKIVSAVTNLQKTASPLFPNLFDLLPKIVPRLREATPPADHARTTIFFHRNAHLFRFHAQLKLNK